eukprot:gene15460-21545_t
MIGASSSCTNLSLTRGTSSLRIKPFTQLIKRFDARRQSLKVSAAETDAPEVAAVPEALDFEFNFSEAKKNNSYTSEDVEAAMAYFRKEGSQPECDKDHLTNEHGVDEDATYFANYDRMGAENADDEEDEEEYTYAGITEAAAGGSSGFDFEMFERLKEAREQSKFQSLSDSAVMSSAMEEDYGDRRDADNDTAYSQQGLGELLFDDAAAADEDEEEEEFNFDAATKMGSGASEASKDWDWLSFLGEAENSDDEDDDVVHPSLELFAPQPAVKANSELELLGLEDEDARDMMELMSAKFLEEESDDDEDEETTDLELDPSVMSALGEFSAWSAANKLNMDDDDLADYSDMTPVESPLLNAGEAQVMSQFSDFFEQEGADSGPLAEFDEYEGENDEDSIWKDIYEDSLEMNKMPMADVNSFFDDDEETWVERILEVQRVVTVKRGGKVQGFRASAVVGNQAGLVGVGVGSGGEIGVAVKRALVDAKKKIIEIPLVGPATIPHMSEVKFKAARVILLPASDGTGVIAGSTIKAVLEVAGVKNVLSKRLGCRSLMNNARATLKALSVLKTLNEELAEQCSCNPQGSVLKTLNEVSKSRGVPMDELLLPRRNK